jgi:hypothetical protein
VPLSALSRQHTLEDQASVQKRSRVPVGGETAGMSRDRQAFYFQ